MVKYTYWDYLFASWFYAACALITVGGLALVCWGITKLTGEWLIALGTMVVLFGVLPATLWAMDELL